MQHDAQQVPVDSLKPFKGNPRRGDITAIRESLRINGQYRPLVVRAKTREVLAGNHTLAAAQAEGWQHVWATFVDVDARAAKRIVLVDNRTNDIAGYDTAELAQLLGSLPSLEGTGYSKTDLEALLPPATSGDTEPGDPPAEPRTKPGDLWLLGDHRLLCGDSTTATDVERLLGGGMPSLIVTDPPYGVDYDPAWRQRAAAEGHLTYAATRVGQVTNDSQNDWAEAWSLVAADVIYCWHATWFTSAVQAGLEAAGYEIRSQIIWSKPHFPISRGHYHWRHEPCWYAVRKGAQAGWAGDRKQTTVWDIALDANVDGGHGTQKPLECMERPVRNHDASEVYEPFAGSGTTVIACENLNRRCYAMEIDAGYCDVIIDRWERHAGRKAERVSDSSDI